MTNEIWSLSYLYGTDGTVKMGDGTVVDIEKVGTIVSTAKVD